MGASAQIDSGRIIAGKYRIEGVLGRGGMGTVYAAVHEVTGKPVALKVIGADAKETTRERLMREARAAGRIHHPNVVDVYDVGEDADGSIFLVMERLQGVPLTAAMAPGPMPAVDAITLLMPVLRGVAAAHAQGVIHRDLKPENVFLCEHQDGSPRTVKVLDFGISKVAGLDIQLTQTGVVLGTPVYMAPEQLRARELDGRCDQYALACILYEMLEGKPPFSARTYPELAALKLEHHPRPMKQPTPRALRAIVFKAMDRRPAKRFADLRAFALALEPFAPAVRFSDTGTDWSAALDHRLTESHETLSSQTPLPDRPRWPLPLGLALLALLAAVAGWWLQGRSDGEPAMTPPPEATRTVAPERPTAAPVAEPEPPAAPIEEPAPTEAVAPEDEPAEATEATPVVRRRARRRRSPMRAGRRSGSLSIDDF